MTIRTNPLSYTVPEFLKASILVNLRKFWIVMFIFVAVAAGCQIEMGWTSVAVVYVLFALILPIARPLINLSSAKFRKLLNKSLVLEFDDTHMRVYKDDDLVSKTSLEDLDRAYRVAEFWIIRVARMLDYIVPVRIFKSREDLAALEEILRKNNLIR